LTERERDVLKLVTGGKTDREIAQVLQISAKTVGNHISSILDKLRVGSRMRAAAWALKEGLIEQGDE
jgi:DNA-binding NarL/FixJ family response regulator